MKMALKLYDKIMTINYICPVFFPEKISYSVQVGVGIFEKHLPGDEENNILAKQYTYSNIDFSEIQILREEIDMTCKRKSG